MNQSTSSFSFLLGSKTFAIPSRFNKMLEFPQDIYHDIVFNINHQYKIKSNVSEEVLKSFIK